MPQATDLSIENGTGVAKTFALLTPAAGDKSPALWALQEGAIRKVFPTITESARANVGNNARKCEITLKVPSSYTDGSTGLTALGSSAVLNITATVPDDFPEALKNDFAAFAKNAVANAVLNACIRDGLPAT